MLGYDGVLHSDEVFLRSCDPNTINESDRRFLTADHTLVTGTDLFGLADRLTAALDPFPNVMIVITSTWRDHFDLDALKGFLPPALAARRRCRR